MLTPTDDEFETLKDDPVGFPLKKGATTLGRSDHFLCNPASTGKAVLCLLLTPNDEPHKESDSDTSSPCFKVKDISHALILGEVRPS